MSFAEVDTCEEVSLWPQSCNLAQNLDIAHIATATVPGKEGLQLVLQHIIEHRHSVGKSESNVGGLDLVFRLPFNIHRNLTGLDLARAGFLRCKKMKLFFQSGMPSNSGQSNCKLWIGGLSSFREQACQCLIEGVDDVVAVFVVAVVVVLVSCRKAGTC